MSSYPWGGTSPSQADVNLPDTASVAQGQTLVFTDRGTPPARNFEAHNWAAAFGSDLTPQSTRTGPNFRGSQDPAVICPATGEAPAYCDDTAFGRGVGGRLTWEKVRARQVIDNRSRVSLPGDPLLADSVQWSKQMLAASEQEATDVRLRWVDQGRAYPPATGTLTSMRWLGAGWPDYSWLFGTDGEYTAFAAVAAGQFGPIKAHLRALRDVSEIINPGTGKIVHEVTPDGAVYFGADADPGNTDESAKYPSAVALVWRWTGDQAFLRDLHPASVKAMHYVASLDADNDGWPAGLGNVERAGMGEEKLDNAVYTIRGYADLADLAQAQGDAATRGWAIAQAQALLDKFENDWWYGADARSYADSLGDGNTKVFQRHWIGLTPTDAVLPRLPGRSSAPLASLDHANTTLDQHERPCYTGEFGLFHTGTGPTSAPAGNPGPSCDSVLSTVPSERSIFTLNSAIAAVSEGNYGRLAPDQQSVYTTGNARSQLDPTVWEMPGMMPEIVPSPDFGANIDKPFTDRSMVMQAWGAYGTIWPVIHQWLGVSPDMGRGRISVVPQVPAGQTMAAGRDIRLGSGSIDVAARHSGSTYVTTVTRQGQVALTIGAVLPPTASIASATLDDHRVTPQLVSTTRGLEASVSVGTGRGTSTLVIETE
jgi:hypothetical protein